MKLQIIFLIFTISLGILTLSSCKELELDTPPYHIPEADTSGGTMITIEQLKNLPPSPLPSPGIYLIDSNYFVKGIITANDESGNIYKKLYMQDSTGGIVLSIDAKDMYLKYPIGQTVYLNCKGFYLGNSYGIPQFGSVFEGGPGRIISDKIDTIVMLDGLPDLSFIPDPKTVVGASGFSTSDLSKLVKITNVSFQEAGTNLFANPGESYPERTVVDANGNTMVLSNSSYATFANDTLPEGTGDITGILSTYNSEYRLYIRDIDDIQMYTSILAEYFGTEPSGWDKKSISGDAAWIFNSTDLTMKINGWDGDGTGAGNDDYLVSASFDLSTAVNPILSFSSRRRFADTETEPMAVYITTDYTGDASTTSWTKLSATFDLNTTSSFTGWVSSGEINLSEYSGSDVRIAFRYKSSSDGNGSASFWDIDNVSIVDK